MFKDIKGYPGYMVNENGIVINKKGHVMRPGQTKDKISGDGRIRVSLEVYDENGKLLHRDNLLTYRLAAEAFIPNPDNLPLVMHKDNDYLHNHISNLKWGTPTENTIQGYVDRRHVSPNTGIHNYYIYEVYNDDETDVIKCKGRQGVAELAGFTREGSVIVNSKLKSGPYAGYNVRNTGEICKQALIPINKSSEHGLLSQEQRSHHIE